MRTRFQTLTIGLMLATAAMAGCSSTTAGSSGAVQDDVASAAPASAGAATAASTPASDSAAPETGANQDLDASDADADELGAKQVTAPPLTPPSQSCTTPIADNAWTSSPSLGPNGGTAQTYPFMIEVPVGSNCTNFVWISTTVSPSGGGGLVAFSSGGEANPMNNMKIPSTKNNNQEVIYYSGNVGTTVFQIQDSTGTLGGTYTVDVVTQ
jgi:hypothetical protein